MLHYHDSQKDTLFDTKIPKLEGYISFFSFSRSFQISTPFWDWGNVSDSISIFLFLQDFYSTIFVYFQKIVANFINIITQLKKIVALLECDGFVFIRRCGAKVTQNEKWRPFGGRWIKKTKTNMVEFSEKSWIRQAASSFWGFLCQTKVFFVNRG